MIPGTYTLSVVEPYKTAVRIGPMHWAPVPQPFVDHDDNGSEHSQCEPKAPSYREHLCLRDGSCLVTDTEDIDVLAPAYIIPEMFGQEYMDRFTNYPGQVTLLGVNNGLLLRTDMQRSFDACRWSIYANELGQYYVHVFGESYHEYHGKEIHFRCKDKHKLPHINLLRWHYQQCLMARVRGSLEGRWF